MYPHKIVLASHNAGKIREMRELLSHLPIELTSQADLGIPPADETASTFIENALLKARHASLTSGLPALADDSGLVVDALNGAPGVHSARFAGEARDPKACIQKLLETMQDVPGPQRTARYVSVIAFLAHANDPTPIVCEAYWEGMIHQDATGIEGFGYDPLFYIPKLKQTAAQIPLSMKNQFSHRAKSMRLWLEAMQQRYGS